MTLARFLQAAGALRSAATAALADGAAEVSVQKWRVLHLIANGSGGSLAELACALGVVPQAVNRDVSQLAACGLIDVERSEEDGRRRVYRLTAEGERVDRAVSERARSALRRVGVDVG